MDTEFRTPSFEELKEGDEVEIMSSYGWQKGTWPTVLDLDTHVNLFGGDTLESKFRYASLRVEEPSRPSVNDAVSVITFLLKKISEAGRVEVFDNFCHYCGTDTLPCHCMNDE